MPVNCLRYGRSVSHVRPRRAFHWWNGTTGSRLHEPAWSLKTSARADGGWRAPLNWLRDVTDVPVHVFRGTGHEGRSVNLAGAGIAASRAPAVILTTRGRCRLPSVLCQETRLQARSASATAITRGQSTTAHAARCRLWRSCSARDGARRYSGRADTRHQRLPTTIWENSSDRFGPVAADSAQFAHQHQKSRRERSVERPLSGPYFRHHPSFGAAQTTGRSVTCQMSKSGARPREANPFPTEP